MAEAARRQRAVAGGDEHGLPGGDVHDLAIGFELGRAVQAHDGARADAPDSLPDVRVAQMHVRQLEVVDGRIEGRHRPGDPLGRDPRGRRGGRVEDAQEFGDVDVLVRQPGAQDVVRGGHDLHAHAAEVGVDRPGREEEGLPRPQRDGVEQQRRDDARVPRIPLGQAHDD